MKVSGNAILITGGATGIGLALAELFLSQGNEVLYALGQGRICEERRTDTQNCTR